MNSLLKKFAKAIPQNRFTARLRRLRTQRREDQLVRGELNEAEVVVYFAESPDKLYQMKQWLPVLERLHEMHRTALVVRNLGSFHLLVDLTHLPLAFVRTYPQLVDFYATQRPLIVAYVNNGMKNFQSLGFAEPIHVHLGHGESDKTSSVSHQLRAYDRVMASGPAAVARVNSSLFEPDSVGFLQIGRPPLDICSATSIADCGEQTVLYAPTWQGETAANNYTSVDIYGVQIVRALLGLDGVRVIYKPHPRITRSADVAVIDADREIRAMISQTSGGGCPHLVADGEDLLGLFTEADVVVADVSSVGLDFLYQYPDRGLVLTDRWSSADELYELTPLSSATPVINEATVSDMAAVVAASTDDPAMMAKKIEMRRYYFGELGPGDSIHAFTDEIAKLCELAERRRTQA